MSVELHFSHFKFRAETKKVDISVRVQVEKQSLKWRVNRAIQVFPEAQNKENSVPLHSWILFFGV